MVRVKQTEMGRYAVQTSEDGLRWFTVESHIHPAIAYAEAATIRSWEEANQAVVPMAEASRQMELALCTWGV